MFKSIRKRQTTKSDLVWIESKSFISQTKLTDLAVMSEKWQFHLRVEKPATCWNFFLHNMGFNYTTVMYLTLYARVPLIHSRSWADKYAVLIILVPRSFTNLHLNGFFLFRLDSSCEIHRTWRKQRRHPPPPPPHTHTGGVDGLVRQKVHWQNILLLTKNDLTAPHLMC